MHPSNISGRHARDTDTGPWHIAYRPGPHTKNSQSGGGSPTSQGPHWSFVNCFYQHANDQSTRTSAQGLRRSIPYAEILRDWSVRPRRQRAAMCEICTSLKQPYNVGNIFSDNVHVYWSSVRSIYMVVK